MSGSMRRSNISPARINQVNRVQLFGAIVALVAPRGGEAAVGAGALDIAIRQKTPIGDGIDLLFGHFLDQPLIGKDPCEMLRQLLVLHRR